MQILAVPGRKGPPQLQKFAPAVLLPLLIAGFAIAQPAYLSAGNINAILLSAGILLIAAIGSTFVILMGSIDLSVGAVATLSGIIVSVVEPQLGLFSIFVGVAVGLAAGLLNGLIYVYLRIPSILVTLGTGTSIAGIVLYISDGSSIPIRDDAFLALTQGSLLPMIPNGAIIAAVVYALMVYVGERTPLGRMTLAIGSDEHTAALVGVRVNRIKVHAFALAGALSGLAGALLASRLGTGTPTMGDYMMLEAVTAVVVGGTSITGGAGAVRLTVLGVLLTTFLANGMNIVAVHPYLQTVIKGAVILLAVFFMSKRPSAEDVK